eukprot:7157535-Prorocentrum_lima.AAC.1
MIVSQLLNKRDDDLEKIELWERAHGRSVKRPTPPPNGGEEFQEYKKSKIRQFMYEYPGWNCR